jgi:uracil-DNA glycosylase family 4
MNYDPRKDGADCDHCPMKRWADEALDVWAPVQAKRARRPGRLFLGEAPGGNEEKRGEPFVGESGKELNEALKDVGLNRRDWTADNVIACRAPKDKWDLIAAKMRRDKKKGKSPAHEKHPAEHCRPRLNLSLAKSVEIVTLGGKAAGAVLGGAPSILAIRGGPVTLRTGVKVLPTVHPAFVRRARRWRRVFRADLRRAIRFFGGRLQWVEPPILYRPTPEQLRAFFATPSRWWSYDVETDAKEPLRAGLRCLAIAKDDPSSRSGDSVVVVPYHLIDSDMRAYPSAVEAEITAILQGAMSDGRTWCGHNAGWYDRLVMEQQLRVRPFPLLDTILLARLSSHGELPKGLGVVGSIHTDVTAWKQDNEGTKLAFGSQNDAQLHHYCAIDTAVTHRIATPLMEDARTRGHTLPCPARPEWTLLSMDHGIQGVCAGMTRAGLLIDPEAQWELEQVLEKDLAVRRANVLRLAGSSTYNPASVPQTRALLYGNARYALEPVAWTDTGDPSTGDAALREHLMNRHTHPEAAEFLYALRGFRKVHKLLTGFVRPLKPADAGGVLDDDGRLRVSWSAHVPVTGRLSSSQPMNVQNWPKALRKLVVPADGNVLVGADFDQLEGRIGAARWGLQTYLDAYRKAGTDPHQITMEFAFGTRVWNLPGAPPPQHRYKKKWPGGEIGHKFNELRQLAKSYYYAKQYAASDETVWELLRKAEGEDGSFTYADLKVTEVAAMSRKFLGALPELQRGWDTEIAFFEANNFNFEPLTGRRRDFLDGPDMNEIVNFPVQASGAALMNIATLDVAAAGYVANYAGPGTGIIQQGHDALVLEVPANHAERARQTLEDCMTQTYGEIYDVTFTAEAEVGMRWSKV